jgi:hypothetical protein
MRATKLCLAVLTITFIASLPAFANKCDSFGSFTCAKSAPDNVYFSGTGSTGQSVGILLGSNSFSIGVTGNRDFVGDDLIILAAAPNGLTGSVAFTGGTGVSFTSMSEFGEDSAISFKHGAFSGAIADTWSGLGIHAGNVQFGYANIGAITSAMIGANGTISVTASGVGQGTIFYAVIVNSDGKIVWITKNSEAGVLDVSTNVTPEPASLTLLGTGLAAVAGLVRRKAKKK